MLVRGSFTSSAKGAFGRHERHDQLLDAAEGAETAELVLPLRMVLALEGIPCRPA
jgi:hypothetical protein